MFLIHFITSRLIKGNKRKFSRPIYLLAIVSVTISIIVMILSLSIVRGYQKTISEKVSGFGSHIQISNYDSNNSYESIPIEASNGLYSELQQLENIKHVQSFCLKAGILKMNDQIEGIVLKGVGNDYDWSFIQQNIVSGKIPTIKDTITTIEALISQTTANKLNVEVGDKVQVYFIQDPPRVRIFNISGIYNSGLSDFDNKFMFVDQKHIQRLNSWQKNQFSGLELILNDFSDIDNTSDEVSKIIPYNQRAQSIKQLYPDLFDWIDLFDVNIVVLISIISMICILTLIATILIFILEQTSFIGLMKAMGSSNSMLSGIFLSLTIRIILWGIFLGNTIALTLLLIQQNFKLIKLDAKNYYIDHIPVSIQISHFLLVDIFSILVIFAAIFTPIYLITKKTSAIKAIRFK